MGQPLKFVDYFRHTIAPSAIEMGTSSVPLASATNEQEWLGCYFESSGQTSYGMRIQIEKTSATAGAPRAVTLRTILGHSSGFAPQGANSVDARVTLEDGNTGISGEMHAMESQCRVDAEDRSVNGTYAAHKFTNNFGAENTMPTDTFFLRFYDAGTVKTPRLFGFTGLTAGTGNLYYNETLKIKVNTNDRWIPLSTAQGTYTTAYPIIGTSDTGFRYNGTLVPDASRLDYAYSMGNRAAELTVNLAAAATQNLELFQANVNLTATAGEPLSASTICLMRLRYTHETTDMTYLRLRALNSYMMIKKEIQDAYGCIHGIDFYTNSVTVNGEAAVGVFNMECNSDVTGTVRGVIVNVYGDGVPSTTSVGLEVRIDGSDAGTLTEGIRIRTVGGNAITTGIYFMEAVAESTTTQIKCQASHLNIQTETSSKTIRLNSQTFTTAASIIGVQVKPRYGVQMSDNIYGMEVEPGCSTGSTFTGKGITGVASRPRMKGGNLSGDVLAYEAKLEYGDSGKTVALASSCLKCILSSKRTFTNGVFPIHVVAKEDTTSWTALALLPDDDIIASHDGSSHSLDLSNMDDYNGYIKIEIGATAHYILTTTQNPSA